MPPLRQKNDRLWFMCTNCPRTFQNHQTLKNHKRVIHGISGLECNSMFVFSQKELDPGLSILRLIASQILEVPIPRNSSLRIKSPVLQIKDSHPEPRPGPSGRKRSKTIEVMVISTNKETGNEQNTFQYAKGLIQTEVLNDDLLQLSQAQNNSANTKDPKPFVDVVGQATENSVTIPYNDNERSINGDSKITDIKVENDEPGSYERERTPSPKREIEIENNMGSQSKKSRTEFEERLDFLDTSIQSLPKQSELHSQIKISPNPLIREPSIGPSASTDDLQVSLDDMEESNLISSAINPLACTICERSFRREDYRLSHESQVHGINHARGKDKPESNSDGISNASEDDEENGTESDIDDDGDNDFDETEEIDQELESEDGIEDESSDEVQIEVRVKATKEFSNISSGSVPAQPGKFNAECNLCKASFDDKFKFALHSLLENFDEQNIDDSVQVSLETFLKPNATGDVSEDSRELKLFECNICIGQVFENRELFASHLLRVGHVQAELESNGNWTFISILKTGRQKRPALRPNMAYCLICQICEENPKFIANETFSDHVRQTHQEKQSISRCAVCDKLCLSQKSLERHFRNEHTKFSQIEHPGGQVALRAKGQTPIVPPREVKHRRYQCDECKIYFAQEAHLIDHKNRHLGLTPYKCSNSNCEKAFPTKMALGHHERFHRNADKYVCGVCGRKFNSKQKHTDHMLSHRSGRELKCDDCGKFFKHYISLRNHRKIHKPEQRKRYECELCGKNLGTAHTLKLHLASHQSLKTYTCDACDKKYIREDCLRRHKRKVHSGFAKIHICAVCGKTFQNAWALEGHEKKHVDDLPFPCNKCDKRFSIRKYLDCHLTNAHGERRFICEVCGDAFKMRNHLQQHESIHTGIPWKYTRKPKSGAKAQEKKRKIKTSNDQGQGV